VPTRSEIASDQIARHEGEDRLMVSLARAIFDLVLPTETAGARTLLKAQREETEFRKLFEKAIGNFFASELSRDEGWRVYPGKQYVWPVSAASPGIRGYLPIMITDIILENEAEGRRIIIDTKFTNILTPAQHGGFRFKRDHIFQLFAYLRSQESADDPLSLSSDGMLLYPAIGLDLDESALIQGHCVRFATIDLSRQTVEVVQRLRMLPNLSALDQKH
jgi:5-methylcytosine-specific restriction enzyme subunit McrC